MAQVSASDSENVSVGYGPFGNQYVQVSNKEENDTVDDAASVAVDVMVA